jgi:hypothetical protein
MLFYVAPLPILIASLGWNHRTGLIGAAVGGAALALVVHPAVGLAFAVVSALPAWWLAYLALLGRAAPDGTTEWYPIGRLLLWIAATAALMTVVGALGIGNGDYETYRQVLTELAEAIVRMMTRTAPDAPLPPTLGGIPIGEAVSGMVTGMPLLFASSFAMILTLNMLLAAKAVVISQRLPRPWPFIPAASMPRTALWVFVAGIVLAFAPGFVSIAGYALAGALAVAWALQGLALLHDVSRGRPGRMGLLVGAYILLVFVGHGFLPLLAVAGLADTAIGLRRLIPGPGPRPST